EESTRDRGDQRRVERGEPRELDAELIGHGVSPRAGDAHWSIRAGPGSPGQHVDRAPVAREFPVTIAVDAEDLVAEVRHFHLEIERALGRRAWLVDPDSQGPRLAAVRLLEPGAL